MRSGGGRAISGREGDWRRRSTPVDSRAGSSTASRTVHRRTRSTSCPRRWRCWIWGEGTGGRPEPQRTCSTAWRRCRTIPSRAWRVTGSGCGRTKRRRARWRDTAMLPELRERIARMSRFSSYGRDRLMPRYVQGLLLEARGDLPAAAEAYRSSIWSPTENHVSPRLARVLLRLGRPDAAVRVVQSWVRGPLDAANQYVPRWEAHEALADAFDALGASDSAARHRSWVERSRGTRTAAARAGQRSRQL